MTAWTTSRIPPSPMIAIDEIGTGDVLVLMHGIGGNKRNWHPNLAALGAHFRTVAWDARGYGESDDYEGELAFSDYTHDLARVLDHLGARKAHILGLSMGGRIAMDFAEKYPDRLLSLTLCDTHTGYADFSEERKQSFLRLRLEPLESGKEPKDIAEPVARSLVSPKASQEAFMQLVDSMCRLHKASYMKSIKATVLSDTHKRLADIRVPTHVIVGADDKLTTPEMARGIAGQIKGARLTVIPDAGHLVNIEQPAAFNAAALAFLRGVSGR